MKRIASVLLLFAVVFSARVNASDEPTPDLAKKDVPFVNSVGMKFVPVEITGGPTNGKRVLLSIWDTRVKDFRRYAEAANYHQTGGMEVIGVGGVSTWDIDLKATWEHPGFEQTGDYPVVGVRWDDAKRFCRWLTETEHASRRLTAKWRYRMPTDHEWSCAVGIGRLEKAEETAETKSGKIADVFPWGKQWPPPRGAGNYADETAKRKWNCEKFIDGYYDGYAYTSPVGKFLPNRFGIYDLGGNVWQWCDDFGDSAKLNRTLRGGSWCESNAPAMGSSFRIVVVGEMAHIAFGFRCVLVDDSQ